MARYGRKGFNWKMWLGAGVLVVVGALFKNKVLGTVRKLPVVGKVEDVVGENAKNTTTV